MKETETLAETGGFLNLLVGCIPDQEQKRFRAAFSDYFSQVCQIVTNFSMPGPGPGPNREVVMEKVTC